MQNKVINEPIVIGKVSKPHGVRGFLKVVPETDEPDRFNLLSEVAVRLPFSQKIEHYTIENVSVNNGFILLKFDVINTRDAAESLRDCELIIDRSECLPLENGSYYIFDLIGLEVVDSSGQHLGELKEVLQYPAHDVYVVKSGDNEVMVPAVAEIVKGIDLKAGKITIDPLNGMFSDS